LHILAAQDHKTYGKILEAKFSELARVGFGARLIRCALVGDRVVDVLPAPGHHPAQLLYYDRHTGLVFSGDFLLPGRLLVDDWRAYHASAQRAAEFLNHRPVSYVLGGHVEKNRSGELLPGNPPTIRMNTPCNFRRTICWRCRRRCKNSMAFIRNLGHLFSKTRFGCSSWLRWQPCSFWSSWVF
jgi:hypothetical protein